MMMILFYYFLFYSGGPLRDWNEEYQSCFELPQENVQDR